MQKDKKNKHMELEDRIEIQECLCKGMNFKSIALRIGKRNEKNKENRGKISDQMSI